MTINFNKKTIELSKSEMKEAKIFGSDMYKDLQTARKDYPKFKVVELKARKNTSDFANLTMETIRNYVAKNGTDDQKATFAFISKRTVKEDGEYCEPQPFFSIKTWFLNEFPEFKNARKAYREKITSIYDAAASKNVA